MLKTGIITTNTLINEIHTNTNTIQYFGLNTKLIVSERSFSTVSCSCTLNCAHRYLKLLILNIRMRLLWIKADINHPVETVTASPMRTVPWVTAIEHGNSIRATVLRVLVGNLERADSFLMSIASCSISPVYVPPVNDTVTSFHETSMDKILNKASMHKLT